MIRVALSLLSWLALPAGLTAFLTPAALGQLTTNGTGTAAETHVAHLPLVVLDARQPIVPDPRVPCTVKIVPPNALPPANTNPLPAMVRIHGATSQGFPKKSYSLTLETPAPWPGLRESRHWVLNAAYIDRSLMRHKLSYDLFRSLSAKDHPRFAVASRFVEVRLNGHYNGVYLLMERLDRELLGLRPFRSNDLSHACVYKAVDHAANFGQPGHDGYEQREPDPTVRPYWEPLDQFNRFVSGATPSAFFDLQTGIGARLDLDNAIDFHLLVLLTSNSDGITKNFFLARDGQGSGAPTPRFFFAPWDYDGTFGRNWDGNLFPPTAWLSNHLFDRLLSGPAYRARFAARWNQLRRREFSVATIDAMIDDNARTLGPAARRNAARWPTTGGGYPDELTFEEDLAQIKAWTRQRLEWLDRAINGKP